MPEPAPSEPTPPSRDSVTVLLEAAGRGEAGATARLFEVVHHELRVLARAQMNQERRGHTLQATALVNEAYLRLLGREDVRWEGRGHFFRAAADSMRKILIDHARARNAGKRGGGRRALDIASLEGALAADDSSGILALDEAIVRLEQVDAPAAEVVRLKFYAGLTDAAIAGATGQSERTVRRAWAFARGWLRDALEQDSA